MPQQRQKSGEYNDKSIINDETFRNPKNTLVEVRGFSQMVGKNIEFCLFPGRGFGKLVFGMDSEQIKDILGEPEEEYIDEDEGHITFHYPKKGLEILGFDDESGLKLTSIELNKLSQAKLWDSKIFSLKLNDIRDLAERQGYILVRKDVTTGDDKSSYEALYQIKKLELDLYIDSNQKLTALCLGVNSTKQDEIKWPK